MFSSCLKQRLAPILSALGVLIVLSGVYTWFLGAATLNVWQARSVGRQVPIVWKTPVPLRDVALSQEPGRKLTFCNYQFEIPWSDVDESKTKSYPTLGVLYFRSGLVLMVTCSAPRAMVELLQSKGKIDPQSFRQVFGDGALQSDYAFTRLMLGTTPDKVGLRTNQQDAVGTLVLLLIKAIAMPPADSGVFSIHTGGFDGFQYEDPQAHPKRVVATLFAPDKTVEFCFFLRTKSDSIPVSQLQINRVLQSLQKVPVRVVRPA